MSDTLAAVRNLLKTISRSYVTVVVIALLVGASVAPIVWGATSSPDGTVAVIEIDQSITEPTADAVAADLQEARENESIDAVVLKVDSPGGGVTASERLYLAVERTAQEMPVVTSVQATGASGAYYLSAPSDRIYVAPSSIVGSIGVRATYIDAPMSEGQIATGPDKAVTSEEQLKQQTEMMKQTFLGTVMDHRGDELTLTETELAYAKTYTGTEAVENGLADEIGDTEVAIGAAADRAGLDDYDVVTMEREQSLSLSITLEDGGEQPTASPQHRPQTFGNYGGVNTPAFLAMWGSISSETVVDATDGDASLTGVTNATAADRGGEQP
ncbi:S49 family peptidase [Halosolutus gelatinilyticus]|uniref:S49 family peptidase n=1 Tax=Halosolutus gelatinilyticus TaxID=2931975 RepID=UPI001FF20A59|nr:S49 family peptidase [Halosolutus gelatinilyticus]